MSPPLVAVIVVLAAAWLWHSVRDHYWHLALLRVVRPSTVVPATRHDSRWHAMSHPNRLLVNVMMTGAALLAGLAWELSPYIAASLAVIAAIAGIVLAVTRAMTRISGGQQEETHVRHTERSKS